MGDQKSRRIVDLDVLRGVAVAGMIIVNSPGDWAHTYWPLEHAAWNGWTPTDMVFPAFLFAVGMALGLSFPRSLSTNEERRTFWVRVVRRTVALILLGLALNATYNLAVALGQGVGGPDNPPALRLPGVPQRIALCYALTTVLIVLTGRRGDDQRIGINVPVIVGTIAVILLGYWALLSFVPVPGYGAGKLDMEGSLTAYIDRLVFTPRHMWALGSATWRGPVTYDPEGLLSTLPATVNTLFGVLAGREWKKPNGPALGRVALVSAAVFVAGLLLDLIFPVNKRLWTSSFALLSSGFAGLTLVAVSLAVRSMAVRPFLAPFLVLGGNAVLAYAISELMGGFSGIPFGPKRMSAQGWGDALALKLFHNPYIASLACAVAILVIVTLLIWPLHRRAIHFRL